MKNFSIKKALSCFMAAVMVVCTVPVLAVDTTAYADTAKFTTAAGANFWGRSDLRAWLNGLTKNEGNLPIDGSNGTKSGSGLNFLDSFTNAELALFKPKTVTTTVFNDDSLDSDDADQALTRTTSVVQTKDRFWAASGLLMRKHPNAFEDRIISADPSYDLADYYTYQQKVKNGVSDKWQNIIPIPFWGGSGLYSDSLLLRSASYEGSDYSLTADVGYNTESGKVNSGWGSACACGAIELPRYMFAAVADTTTVTDTLTSRGIKSYDKLGMKAYGEDVPSWGMYLKELALPNLDGTLFYESNCFTFTSNEALREGEYLMMQVYKDWDDAKTPTENAAAGEEVLIAGKLIENDSTYTVSFQAYDDILGSYKIKLWLEVPADNFSLACASEPLTFAYDGQQGIGLIFPVDETESQNPRVFAYRDDLACSWGVYDSEEDCTFITHEGETNPKLNGPFQGANATYQKLYIGKNYSNKPIEWWIAGRDGDELSLAQASGVELMDFNMSTSSYEGDVKNPSLYLTSGLNADNLSSFTSKVVLSKTPVAPNDASFCDEDETYTGGFTSSDILNTSSDKLSLQYCKTNGGTEWTDSTNGAGTYYVRVAFAGETIDGVTYAPCFSNVRKITINPIPITLTAASQEWTYDGSAHTNTAVTVTSGSLRSGDTVVATATGSVTNVSDTAAGNNPVAAGYKIMHGDTDVTSYYNISTVAGTLTVQKKPVTITAQSHEFTYTGSVQFWDYYNVEGLVGDDAVSATVTGSITFPSESPVANTVSSYEFTSGKAGNYNVTTKSGQLTMKAADIPITISGAFHEWVYDGEAHSDNTVIVTSGALLPGDTLVARATGSVTNVADTVTYNNPIADDYVIMHGDEDVTACYIITLAEGTLKIKPKEVTVKAQDKAFTYDGTAQSWNHYDVEGLCGTDAISAVVTGSIFLPSDSPAVNELTSYEFTSGIPGNYNVTTKNGQLTMTNASQAITITAASEEFTYDGAAHTNNAVSVTSGSLFAGDALVATATGSVTNVADTAAGNNAVADGYKIMHGDTDVTDNYVITTETGTLTVEPAKVTVTVENKQSPQGAWLEELTYTVDGVAAGDDLGIALSTQADPDKPGEYSITATSTNANYDVTVVDGVYTVVEKPAEPTPAPAPAKEAKVTKAEKAEAKTKLNSTAKSRTTSKGVTVYWGKVKNADKYVIYAAYCGKANKYKKIATVKGDKTAYTIKKLKGKKLNQKKCVKAYVVAYRKVDGKYVKLAKSVSLHAAGTKSKYSNVKKITLKKKAFTLKKGRTATIKATIKLENEKKKAIKHEPLLRYTTSNKKVATVTKNGKIKAKGKGTCKIYVISNNGMTKAVKVTVK